MIHDATVTTRNPPHNVGHNDIEEKSSLETGVNSLALTRVYGNLVIFRPASRSTVGKQ